MKTVVVTLALAGALVAQSALAGLFVGRTVSVNLVLVAVVYVALLFGAVPGLLAGTIGGLAQDALGGGIIGIGGLAKTMIGFLVGVLAAQFNLSTSVPRLVMFVAATFVHEVVFGGLQAITGGRHFALKFSVVLLQALINGLIGWLAFVLVENAPQAVANRRMRRATLSKRRF
ncbi:MAG TPA: rod shape-determining protein MreD [Vicinamibacterales bacterium]|nr:rod shape-determining protein MreD [Vicinamibacterales bacterium]